jgi:ABC-type lipoprotein export system ATPase subunit
MNSCLVKTIDLSKSYQEGPHTLEVLKSVDLEITSGTWTNLVGASGCGKSTLLHLIAGLDRPSAGKIFFLGQDISQWTKNDLALYRRDQVAVVFQFFNLFSALSVEENLMVPLMLKPQSYAASLKQIHLLLESLDMKDLLPRRVHDLSGGERQRIALCRALLTQPKLLLADEPTGSLDAKSGQAVLELLRYAREQLGMTIFVVTHDAHLNRWSERVLQMKDGRLIA